MLGIENSKVITIWVGVYVWCLNWLLSVGQFRTEFYFCACRAQGNQPQLLNWSWGREAKFCEFLLLDGSELSIEVSGFRFWCSTCCRREEWEYVGQAQYAGDKARPSSARSQHVYKGVDTPNELQRKLFTYWNILIFLASWCNFVMLSACRPWVMTHSALWRKLLKKTSQRIRCVNWVKAESHVAVCISVCIFFMLCVHTWCGKSW